MTIENKVKPEDDLYYEFKEGVLYVFADPEEKYPKNRLEFGRFIGEGFKLEGYAYLVFLEDLKKLNQYIFPLRFKQVNDYTMARRTLGLGLQVMRTKHKQSMFTDTAKFSRKEYKTIEQVVKLYA